MNARLFATVASLALGLGYAAAACGHAKPPPPVEPQVTETVADGGVDEEPAAPKSLYDRLGGKDGIGKIVDSFLQNMQIDPKLKNAFAKTTGAKADHFKQALADLLCQETGGDCKYAGKDMKAAHAGMKITDDQWNAAVADLTMALDEFKIVEQDKSELFVLLAKLKDDVVSVKKPEKKKP